MRFHFDKRKGERLRANPKRRVGFEEAQQIFSHPFYLDQRSDLLGGWAAVHGHFRSAGGRRGRVL